MYRPTSPPTRDDEWRRWVMTELQSVAAQMEAVAPYIVLQTLYAAPAKTPEGMVVKADGTTWNPGSGAGVYVRQAGAWVKL